jgi:putative oxidoreductase
MLSIGLLILRIVLGGVMIGHGAQKLFGWFGGRGLTGAYKMIEALGYRPVWFWACMSGLTEFGGGLLFLAGFLTPLGSLGIIAAMLTAIIKSHWKNGFWNTNRGFEFPLVNLTAALALALTGPGLYSLDALFKISLPEPITLLLGLVLVILGVLAQDLTKHSAASQSTSARGTRQP